MVKVHYSRREVIEKKLLAALDDEDKVAVILSESDARMVLRVFEGWFAKERAGDRIPDSAGFYNDLKRLVDEAFQ